MNKLTLGNLIGSSFDDDFLDFDLTEVQEVLSQLKETDAIDLAHAEFLQQRSLRGADIISEFLGKIIKIVSYYESKVSSAKNKVSLEYTADNGRTTAEMKKWAGESDPLVEELQIKLAKAKGSKILLEKKFDILIKTHHHYKDISAGLRKTIMGNTTRSDGWE